MEARVSIQRGNQSTKKTVELLYSRFSKQKHQRYFVVATDNMVSIARSLSSCPARDPRMADNKWLGHTTASVAAGIRACKKLTEV
jgi:hypothetical protein